MANFNKVILVGNVTKNPEMKYSSNGKAVVSFGLAVNRKSKEYEETLFVDITAFGRLAEIIGEYVTKGNPLLVEGRLRFNTWEQDGQKRSKYEVVAENIQLLGGNKNSSGSGNNSPKQTDSFNENDVPF